MQRSLKSHFTHVSINLACTIIRLTYLCLAGDRFADDRVYLWLQSPQNGALYLIQKFCIHDDGCISSNISAVCKKGDKLCVFLRCHRKTTTHSLYKHKDRKFHSATYAKKYSEIEERSAILRVNSNQSQWQIFPKDSRFLFIFIKCTKVLYYIFELPIYTVKSCMIKLNTLNKKI